MTIRILPAALALCAFAFAAEAQTTGAMSDPNHMAGQTAPGCTNHMASGAMTSNHMSGGAMSGEHMASGTMTSNHMTGGAMATDDHMGANHMAETGCPGAMAKPNH